MHRFSPGVVVQSDRPGVGYSITDVEQAAEFLLAWKAIGAGPKWQDAVRACKAVLNDAGTVGDAREAFEKAARECGRLIG
ncbi:DUF982 domain-containing protein [Bosea sp. BIWAKO-01]|uniref:DUF982 domain-containing protein n=1 Tax=Bosea sp. BIWAKO-01 TaxID=506668 RepID=UPI00352A95A1